MTLSLAQAWREGEGQYVEFKESLALTSKAAQALVAFANAQGGQVFIGVTDKKKAIGVDVGRNTVEQMIGTLEAHIYPSLPFEVDLLPAPEGRKVIRVAVPHDVPPVIGAYLYASNLLDPAAPVEAASLHAYRRVGKTTRKIDFMWLRGRVPSDPVVLIDGRHGEVRNGSPTVLNGGVWLAEGTGPAYAIRVSTDPPITQDESVARDLPPSGGPRAVPFGFQLDLGGMQPTDVWLIATYRDDWGCVWESRRRMEVGYGAQAGLRPTSEFSRRIITFPPKTLASPRD